MKRSLLSLALALSFFALPSAQAKRRYTSAYFGVWGSGPDDVYVVGVDFVHEAGLILHTSDHGSSWQPLKKIPVDPLENQGLAAIWGSAKDDVYAVGEK